MAERRGEPVDLARYRNSLKADSRGLLQEYKEAINIMREVSRGK